MLILGLSDSHDASVALVEDGKIIAAVSEERFTRRKRQQGFPHKSLEYVKGLIRGRNLEKVYISGKYGRSIFRVLDRIYAKGDPNKDILSFSSKISCWLENTIALIPVFRGIDSYIGLCAIKRRLKKSGVRCCSIELVDHHYSHIVSSLTAMDSNDYLAVSLDAYGDGKSGLVVNVENKKVVNIKKIYHRDSISQFYAYICSYLGFLEGEEGKVMALAAFGSNKSLQEIFRKFFSVGNSGIRLSPKYKSRSFLMILKSNTKEDIAFALQETVEGVVLEFIKTCLLKDNHPDLFLSGGFFANIKVNQRLHQTGFFKRIFIFPNMGDGGLPLVSVIPEIEKKNPEVSMVDIYKSGFLGLKDVYLGPEYDDRHIECAINDNSFVYSLEINIEEKIARLLSEGKTIARFNARMEFGPRALGNRSILCQATDRSVNDWLNKKLKRAEFMPFAPVTLFDHKDKCYLNIAGIEAAAKFMTISVDCTEWMKKVSPGVVHIDGTARPQLIKEEDNPSYYKILKAYHGLTGIPSLINTSLNIHGEPICCSPEEAIQTFKAAKLDYLAISKFLVKGIA